MTVDFFVSAYDFDNFVVKKATLNNHKLKVYVTINAHLDLIANGYRPELDVDYDTAFIFSVEKETETIKTIDKFNCYNDNGYYVEIGNNKYKLTSNSIEIEK